MTPKQYKYHAETLAEAIRQFRNVPELRKLVKIRATPQFVGLVRAWGRLHGSIARGARAESECDVTDEPKFNTEILPLYTSHKKVRAGEDSVHQVRRSH